MLYLNADSINTAGLNWEQLTTVIRQAVTVLHDGNYSQPIKPYLRYGNAKNRIIAMPAYIGGEYPWAGIKWIASFPDNIHQHKLRANSVTILNEHDSGIPLCVINTSAISAIRTAAVSGLLVEEYLQTKTGNEKLNVGINGFGPIGIMHLKMITAILGERIGKIYLYDIKSLQIDAVPEEIRDKVVIGNTWEEGYEKADIFITCTVSAAPYIDKVPVKGSLQLNVSLRDYKAEMKDHMDVVIVDDWDEVCRENTDIENMHKVKGLRKSDTLSIADIVCKQALKDTKESDTIMFNPMGMAIFDIAVGGYYYREALNKQIGFNMPD
ncbi:ornithine cyclodeaminase [Chitinophaga sp. CF118]|uniref:2,3-diaminopropionate biosynthesis protein SbnB n=1 Tax=Chitinophaga sp. CF118 TaxID=1884367 RepID=UPI0008E08262|nr:2,3-diaminopropionate biosynthesis protein SbnB [Chitinophaga sp. CF118]SFE91388.1 ornithine cyclodeaminase [Chitinophaga sp. CF118]